MSLPACRVLARTARGPRPLLEVLADACAESAAVLLVLDALLSECLRVGASRLHVEIDSHGARARLRRDGTLESRRLDLGNTSDALRALDAALESAFPTDGNAWRAQAVDGGAAKRHLAPRERAFRVGPADLLAHVVVKRTAGPACASVVFEVTHWTPHAPILEELLDDGAAAGARLRALLARDGGLVVVTGTDASALAALGDAIAQACSAPERKVVRGSAEPRHPLAGVVQFGIVAEASGDSHRLLGQDADVIVFDESPARTARTAATDLASGRALIVRTLVCAAPIDALHRLCAEGADARWLAWRLRGVVRVDQLRTLCAACRRPSSSEALAGGTAASQALVTPLSLALAGSLQRFCDAPGCAHCEGTGIERTGWTADVLGIDRSVTRALTEGSLERAAEALDGARTLPDRARALARRGLVSIEEAGRIERG